MKDILIINKNPQPQEIWNTFIRIWQQFLRHFILLVHHKWSKMSCTLLTTVYQPKYVLWDPLSWRYLMSIQEPSHSPVTCFLVSPWKRDGKLLHSIKKPWSKSLCWKPINDKLTMITLLKNEPFTISKNQRYNYQNKIWSFLDCYCIAQWWCYQMHWHLPQQSR